MLIHHSENLELMVEVASRHDVIRHDTPVEVSEHKGENSVVFSLEMTAVL